MSAKALIFMSLLFLDIIGARAQFAYATNDGVLTVTDYVGSNGTVTIPASAYGMPVSEIGAMAFSQSENMTNIVIPDSVVSIGAGAFAQSDLCSITIPDSVTNIGDWAFFYCTRLASAVIPSSVATIGVSAFAGCGALTTVTMPTGVTSLGDSAFEGCIGMTQVVLGASVAHIGNSAFSSCGLAGELTIPAAVTNIGEQAFYDCPSLTNISVDPGNPSYSSLDGVLFDKYQASLLQFPAGLAGNYIVPASVGMVADYAFALGALSGVAMQDGVTSIGDGAFEQCIYLTNAFMGSGVTNIGDLAFQFCYSLRHVGLGNNVASIGASAFSRCSLSSLSLSATVTSIGAEAFSFCANLTNVYFAGNAPAIGYGTFDHDQAVTVYYSPDTAGWGDFGASAMVPALPWSPAIQAGAGFRSGGAFTFTVSGIPRTSVVVEACTNLSNPTWVEVKTGTLAGGSLNFSDSQSVNYPSRYYRLRPVN